MALSDDDVREILRLIDDAELDELRIETEGLSLHVVKGGSGRAVEPAAARSEQQRDEASSAAAPRRRRRDDRGADDRGLYRAPSPGAPPFVDVGTRVEADTIVCLIEVMKMMNSVPAGVAGTIAAFHVENADPVEYGQPLFRVLPA